MKPALVTRRWRCTRCCALVFERGDHVWTETPDGRRLHGLLDCPVAEPGTPDTWRGSMPHALEELANG
jgi:hypothetical protein